MSSSKPFSDSEAKKFKESVVAKTKEILWHKMKALEEEIKLIQESANNEQKSSAGDKHETARAMAQLEVEMHSKRLQELQRQADVFSRLNFTLQHKTISPGAIVILEEQILFLAAGVGNISVNQHLILSIGANSPVSNNLYNRKVDDKITMMNEPKKIIQFF